MFLEKIRNVTLHVSIRWRLTMLFATVFGITFITFSVFIFNFLATTLQKEFDDALYNYTADVSESISLDDSGDLSFQTPALDQGKLYPFALGTALIQIRQTNGKILSQVGEFGSFNVPYHKEFDNLKKGEDAVFRTITKLEGLPNKEAEEYRMITMSIDNSPIPQLILQIAAPMTLLEDQIVNRKHILEIAIPIAFLIAIIGGYILSTRALKPVTEMISTTENIGGEKLSARLPIPPVKDELQTLAKALNEMLARIEKAFQSQERFIADASHQLLSPLTIMRAEIENALRDEKNISKAVLTSNLTEVDHLSLIVQQLLVLARVEAGREAFQFSSVALDEIIMDAIVRANRTAIKKNIRIQFNIDNQTGSDVRPLAKGDSDLLQNMVFNLIENAVKYSASNQQIKVTLTWEKKEQIITVEDNGPGIPEDQINLIFERFHRGGVLKEAGFGLGLAIAKKISDIHQGSLSVFNKYLNSLDNTRPLGCVFSFKIKNF